MLEKTMRAKVSQMSRTIDPNFVYSKEMKSMEYSFCTLFSLSFFLILSTCNLSFRHSALRLLILCSALAMSKRISNSSEIVPLAKFIIIVRVVPLVFQVLLQPFNLPFLLLKAAIDCINCCLSMITFFGLQCAQEEGSITLNVFFFELKINI